MSLFEGENVGREKVGKSCESMENIGNERAKEQALTFYLSTSESFTMISEVQLD